MISLEVLSYMSYFICLNFEVKSQVVHYLACILKSIPQLYHFLSFTNISNIGFMDLSVSLVCCHIICVLYHVSLHLYVLFWFFSLGFGRYVTPISSSFNTLFGSFFFKKKRKGKKQPTLLSFFCQSQSKLQTIVAGCFSILPAAELVPGDIVEVNGK